MFSTCGFWCLALILVIFDIGNLKNEVVGDIQNHGKEYFDHSNNLDELYNEYQKTMQPGNKLNGKTLRERLFRTRVEEEPEKEEIIEDTTPGIQGSAIINVPHNCEQGYALDRDGICRKLWRAGDAVNFGPIINVPYNNHCDEGWKPDSNGICREMWTEQVVQSGPIINVPMNNGCEPGSRPDTQGICRKLWRKRTRVPDSGPETTNDIVPRRVFFDEETNIDE